MSELLEKAEGLLSRARPGEHVEFYLVDGVDTQVRAYEGAVENLTRASSGGVGVRVLEPGAHGARVGIAWAGALDDASVSSALDEARSNSRLATEDEFLAFASPDGAAVVPLTLSDPGVTTTSLDDKIALAISLERHVSADARIRMVESADYSDHLTSVAIASTAGIAAAYERSRAFLSVQAIASDGERDYTGWGMSFGLSPSDLDINDAANDAISRAHSQLGSVKPSTVRCPVVFDPRTAATIFSLAASALSGEAVQRGRSFLADRLGEQVATTALTLVDDPTDARHSSAASFDGEGLASRRNVLISDGTLAHFVYDTVSARRGATTSTGNAVRGSLGSKPGASCRALIPTAGTSSAEEIYATIGFGVYVDSLKGVHSGVNTISGDFSVGVTGRMIRNGVLAEPIREATVASTLQRMLLDTLYLGNDLEFLPGLCAGLTLAIDAVTLSGN